MGKRTRNHRNLKENQYQNRQSRVSTGISLSGRTNLNFQISKVNSMFTECLDQSPLFFQQMKIRGYVYLVQDGAPRHASQKTQNNCDHEKIKIIQQPPCSTDLNQMEYRFEPNGVNLKYNKEFFKKQVNTQQFQTKEQIQACIQTI